MKKENKIIIKDILFGCAVGDALGVPYEFLSRNTFNCTDMSEYGTHFQPKGTWSDDTSMTLCLADCIAKDFSVEKIADNFLRWKNNADFTANGNVFDIGNATFVALKKIEEGIKCTLAGGTDEWSNGNGSLMRIAPLVLYTINMPEKSRFDLCKNISSITHRHDISISACFIYLEFLRTLILSKSLKEAFLTAIQTKNALLDFGINKNTIDKFSMLNENLKSVTENNIKSGGYVIDTLISSLWCVLNTNSYKDAVLKAVNLGDDTDTTGAVTGAIAGILYGYENIPEKWIEDLKNKKLINSIIESF